MRSTTQRSSPRGYKGVPLRLVMTAFVAFSHQPLPAIPAPQNWDWMGCAKLTGSEPMRLNRADGAKFIIESHTHRKPTLEEGGCEGRREGPVCKGDKEGCPSQKVGGEEGYSKENCTGSRRDANGRLTPTVPGDCVARRCKIPEFPAVFCG
jgi:hypothetical protein